MEVIKTVYYEKNKEDNTIETFKLAEERAKALGIKKLVLASTTGVTAKRALDYFKDKELHLIVIPHQYGFKRKENAFPKELVNELIENGHEVHFGTMLFHTENFYGTNIPTIIANFLRCFSEGVKVCYEMVLMATDACLLTTGEKVIAIAGTGKSANTALVMQASSSQNLHRLRVNELICKPFNSYELSELPE